MPEEVTLEDMENATAEEAPAPIPPKLDEVKLEGDNVPEILRGKTAADAMRTIEAMTQSLQISEAARRAAEAKYAAGGQQAQPVVEEPVYDRDKLRELYEQDPIAAMEQMGTHLERQMQRSFESRIEPLANSSVAAGESYAQQQYKDEFALFGDQIQDFVKQLPNKSVLSNKKGWDDLVSYIRGQPKNFEKLLEHRSSGSRESAAASARAAQQNDAGFSVAPMRAELPGAGGGRSGLDDTERRIADNFIASGVFKNHEEYLKWQKTGAQ